MNQLRKKVDLSVFIEGQQYISYIFGSLGLTRRDHIGFGFNQARVSDTGCKNWKSQGIFLESQKIRNSKTSERHCRKNQKNPGSRKKSQNAKKKPKKEEGTYIHFQLICPAVKWSRYLHQTNRYSITDPANYKIFLLKVRSRDFRGAASFQQKVNNDKITRCLTARICQDTHTSSVVFKTSASVLMGATGKRIFW